MPTAPSVFLVFIAGMATMITPCVLPILPAVLSGSVGSRLRPLAIFSSRRVGAPLWKDIPTMREGGTNIEYQMLRGIFGPPNMPTAAAVYYQTMFRQLLDTPEMGKFIADGGFDKAYLAGAELTRWLEQKNGQVRDLMLKAGWIK